MHRVLTALHKLQTSEVTTVATQCLGERESRKGGRERGRQGGKEG